jgi:glycosyltransferase involved in cell wall biosynthesis
MKVWILQTGEPLQIDDNDARAMRAINLSNVLINKGHTVILWSANFDHFNKKHRYRKSVVINYSSNLKIRLINSIGYKKNQGIRRLFDHAQLAFNLHFALKKSELPDVAFIGYPPIETAWVMSKFLKKRNIPIILDVKDMWPEVFLRALPKYARNIGKLLLSPYYYLMNSIFKSATGISSISQDFLNSSVKIARRKLNVHDSINYLTNIEQVYNDSEIIKAQEWLDQAGVKKNIENRCTFIGSLTNAFDWDCVLEAFKENSAELVIAGDGPLFTDLMEKTKNYLNIIMLGRISNVQSKTLAERTNIFIAPYNHSLEFSESLPNKFFDAMQYGKPLLSSVNGSAAQFILQNEIGLIYTNVATLQQALGKTRSNSAECSQMGKRALSIYKEKFAGQMIYEKIVKNLEKLDINNA